MLITVNWGFPRTHDGELFRYEAEIAPAVGETIMRCENLDPLEMHGGVRPAYEVVAVMHCVVGSKLFGVSVFVRPYP